MSRPTDVLYRPRLRSRRLAGTLFAAACLAATLSGVVVLAVLLGSVLLTALGWAPGRPIGAALGRLAALPGVLAELTGRFFSTTSPARAGFRAGIAGSLWLLGLVALTALPVGVGAAVFLEEFAPPGRLRRAIQTNIANLAGVPSIVYGLLGLALFVRAFGIEGLKMGPSLLAGALTLALLVLPIVVIATQEALRAVPISQRQAALALGATRWQMVRDHVLPSALPGILTGTILALSRAIGETAPLLMVGAAGAITWVPDGPFDDYTAMPVEIFNYARFPAGRGFAPIAAGGILLLLGLLLTMNATAILIRNRYSRHARP